MGSISKSLTLLFIVALAFSGLSLITAKPAFAQSTPTPSVPEFTVQLIGPPYISPTTYSLNSSTGQIVAQIGYENQYSSIIITVKNQLYNSSEGTLYYNVRTADHNLNDWQSMYYYTGGYPEQQAGSGYTNITLSVQSYEGRDIDIQVEAVIGQISEVPPTGYPPFPTGEYQLEGSASGWSSTQTIAVPANVPLSPTPTPSPSTPALTPTKTPTSTSVGSPSYASLLLITAVALVVIAFLLAVIISLLLYMRKRRK